MRRYGGRSIPDLVQKRPGVEMVHAGAERVAGTGEALGDWHWRQANGSLEPIAEEMLGGYSWDGSGSGDCAVWDPAALSLKRLDCASTLSAFSFCEFTLNVEGEELCNLMGSSHPSIWLASEQRCVYELDWIDQYPDHSLSCATAAGDTRPGRLKAGLFTLETISPELRAYLESSTTVATRRYWVGGRRNTREFCNHGWEVTENAEMGGHSGTSRGLGYGFFWDMSVEECQAKCLSSDDCIGFDFKTSLKHKDSPHRTGCFFEQREEPLQAPTSADWPVGSFHRRLCDPAMGNLTSPLAFQDLRHFCWETGLDGCRTQLHSADQLAAEGIHYSTSNTFWNEHRCLLLYSGRPQNYLYDYANCHTVMSHAMCEFRVLLPSSAEATEEERCERLSHASWLPEEGRCVFPLPFFVGCETDCGDWYPDAATLEPQEACQAYAGEGRVGRLLKLNSQAVSDVTLRFGHVWWLLSGSSPLGASSNGHDSENIVWEMADGSLDVEPYSAQHFDNLPADGGPLKWRGGVGNRLYIRTYPTDPGFELQTWKSSNAFCQFTKAPASHPPGSGSFRILRGMTSSLPTVQGFSTEFVEQCIFACKSAPWACVSGDWAGGECRLHELRPQSLAKARLAKQANAAFFLRP